MFFLKKITLILLCLVIGMVTLPIQAAQADDAKNMQLISKVISVLESDDNAHLAHILNTASCLEEMMDKMGDLSQAYVLRRILETIHDIEQTLGEGLLYIESYKRLFTQIAHKLDEHDVVKNFKKNDSISSDDEKIVQDYALTCCLEIIENMSLIEQQALIRIILEEPECRSSFIAFSDYCNFFDSNSKQPYVDECRRVTLINLLIMQALLSRKMTKELFYECSSFFIKNSSILRDFVDYYVGPEKYSGSVRAYWPKPLV